MKHPYDLCRSNKAAKPKRPKKSAKTVQSRGRIFEEVNRAALACFASLCRSWLPGGRQQGCEYVVLNPLRNDKKPGSFKINTTTGRWADFAFDDIKGGDPISLRAYIDGSDQLTAARTLATELGVDV